MPETPNVKAENILYIFIDESGDLVFSDKGSKYFILTAVSTLKPLEGRIIAFNARYELLKSGHDLEYFHATENAQHIRDKFYAQIKAIPEYEIDSVIAEKRKANFALYEEINISERRFMLKKVEEKFYKQICETLLQYIINRYKKFRPHIKISSIIVVLDQVLHNKKREFVTKSIKTYIKDNFGLVPHMYFHSTKADINCQIADYCCWAIKKKWTDQELRPYDEIKHNIKSEFEIFRKGTRMFY